MFDVKWKPVTLIVENNRVIVKYVNLLTVLCRHFSWFPAVVRLTSAVRLIGLLFGWPGAVQGPASSKMASVEVMVAGRGPLSHNRGPRGHESLC